MSIGLPQLLLILVLVLLLFGAGKLPKVMGDIGKGVRNLKKGLNEEEEAVSQPEAPKQIVDNQAETPGVSQQNEQRNA